MRLRAVLSFTTLLAAVPLASGCFLVAAGAGAAGAIAYTNRGASATVAGSVNSVFDRALAAFAGQQITETGRATEDNGAKRTLKGRTGDVEVTVELHRATDQTTKVEVIAAKNVVEYDKELAKRVLDRIVP